MADQGVQKKEDRPMTGYYIFMGLVVVTLLIIAGYAVQLYFTR